MKKKTSLLLEAGKSTGQHSLCLCLGLCTDWRTSMVFSRSNCMIQTFSRLFLRGQLRCEHSINFGWKLMRFEYWIWILSHIVDCRCYCLIRLSSPDFRISNFHASFQIVSVLLRTRAQTLLLFSYSLPLVVDAAVFLLFPFICGFPPQHCWCLIRYLSRSEY